MELHQLPYFKALMADPVRFDNLFIKLITERDAGSELVMSMLRQETEDDSIGSALDRILDKTKALLSNGDSVCCMPMLYIMADRNHFYGNSLRTLRKVMDLIDDASDRIEAIEWMTESFDLTECEDCGGWEYNDESRHTISDRYICRYCADNSYRYMDRYDCLVSEDEIVSAIDEYGDRVSIYQEDDDFVWSDLLGMRVHREYQPPEPPVIGSYHSSKSMVRFVNDEWTKLNKRFLGVELEVEMSDLYAQTEPKAQELNDLINGGDVGEKVFFERDGSLANGFEIISQPMSLPAHRKLWEWLRDTSATKGLISHKGRSGSNSKCGLHVHVNRDSLTKLQIAKMVAFVNNPENKDFMTALARRYGEAMTGYCRIKDEKAKVGKAATSGDRYEAVNVTPRKTIEFRIFRGTLKYESLVAAIEFVHALCEYTARCGDCAVSDLGYAAFLKFAETKLPKETQTLRSYVSNRLETA